MKTQQIYIGKAKLNVQVARTGREQAQGLQNVNNLDKDEGMLFSYAQTKNLAFWMKDTTIPLSIAFIDENKKIIQIEDMMPLSDKSVKSNEPAMYALEVNKGWFKDNGISVGDLIKMKDCSNKSIKIGIVKQKNIGKNSRVESVEEGKSDICV